MALGRRDDRRAPRSRFKISARRGRCSLRRSRWCVVIMANAGGWFGVDTSARRLPTRFVRADCRAVEPADTSAGAVSRRATRPLNVHHERVVSRGDPPLTTNKWLKRIGALLPDRAPATKKTTDCSGGFRFFGLSSPGRRSQVQILPPATERTPARDGRRSTSRDQLAVYPLGGISTPSMGTASSRKAVTADAGLAAPICRPFEV